MKRLTRYFFEGLIVVLPAAVTIYFTYLIFTKIDGLFQFKYPGIGFLITLTGILIIGFIASNILAQRLLKLIDELFSRLPLVKIIYNSFRDLIEAFVGDKRKFNTPVLINFSGNEIGVLGFLTEDDLTGLGLNEKVAVYLPHSYNITGNLIIVPKSQITLIDAGAKEVMTFIVSGGLTGSGKNQ